MPRITPFEQHVEQYEAWFREYRPVYESEIAALRLLLPAGRGVEIGVGSGLFAEPLGIGEGVEPSPRMRERAAQRGIQVMEGVAEALPLPDATYDFALMVTAICFVDDIAAAFAEIARILKPGGHVVIGFVDASSPLGRLYEQIKEEDVFYREATFYSVDEVGTLLQQAGFHTMQFRQTIFRSLNEIDSLEPVREGYGEGSFVVIKAMCQA